MTESVQVGVCCQLSDWFMAMPYSSSLHNLALLPPHQSCEPFKDHPLMVTRGKGGGRINWELEIATFTEGK